MIATAPLHCHASMHKRLPTCVSWEYFARWLILWRGNNPDDSRSDMALIPEFKAWMEINR